LARDVVGLAAAGLAELLRTAGTGPDLEATPAPPAPLGHGWFRHVTKLSPPTRSRAENALNRTGPPERFGAGATARRQATATATHVANRQPGLESSPR